MTNFNNIYRRLTSTTEKFKLDFPESTYAESMDRVLDRGIVYSEKSDSINHGTFSFTNGELEGIYVIASVETYLKYAEVVGGGIGSIYSSTETALKAIEATDISPGRISVDGVEVATDTSAYKLFLSSIMKIEDISTYDYVLRDKGIIESSYLRYSDNEGMERLALENIPTGFSFLKKVINHYSSGDLGVTASGFKDVVDRIMDKGIVIRILPNKIIIASVETYLKFAEVVG